MKPSDLPSIEAVEVLEGQHAARLKLDTGRTVFLSPDMTPRASLMPITAHGFAVMEDWKVKDGPAYHVPASLFDVLARCFAQRSPAKKKPLPTVWKGNPADVPTVVDVEALPGGAARLHLADGQSVEVEDAADSFLSPDEYVPGLLCVMEGQSEGLYIVPDVLRLTVMGALGYAPPVGASVISAHLEAAEGGRAVLACRLEDGTATAAPYLYRLPVPAAFDLSGRRSEALAGQPYTLTIHPGTGRAAVFSVSAEVWPAVLPVLTAGSKEGGKA